MPPKMDTAMLLCAGLGTRLRPWSNFWPKPLFPLPGTTILENNLIKLYRHGVRRIVINLHHLPEIVKTYAEKIRPAGMELFFTHEPEILGTAGGIKNAEHILGTGPFFLMNGDVLIDADLDALAQLHANSGALATLLLRPDPEKEKYGTIELHLPTGKVTRFLKTAAPDRAGFPPESLESFMFTGVQIVSGDALGLIEPGGFSGTAEYLYPKMTGSGMKIFAIIHKGYWADIGDKNRYLSALKDIFEGRFVPEKSRGAGGVKLFCTGAMLTSAAGPGVGFVPPAHVDSGARIGANSQIGPYALIGPGAAIGKECVIENSAVLQGCDVPDGTVLKNDIFGRSG